MSYGVSIQILSKKYERQKKLEGGVLFRHCQKMMTSSHVMTSFFADKILSADVNLKFMHTVKISPKNINSIESYRKKTIRGGPIAPPKMHEGLI